MTNTSGNKVDYVFFLIPSIWKSPSWYINFAQKLNEENIVAVPIQKHQLLEVFKMEKFVRLITFQSSLADKNDLSPKLKRLFKVALSNGKLNLYHFSSFGKIDEFAKFQREKSYLFFSLPISIEEMAKKVGSSYHQSVPQDLTWPGGTRGGFPEFEGKE